MTNWEWKEHEKTNGELLLEILGDNRYVSTPDFPLMFMDDGKWYFDIFIDEDWFNAPCNTITTKDGRLQFSYEPMKESDTE